MPESNQFIGTLKTCKVLSIKANKTKCCKLHRMELKKQTDFLQDYKHNMYDDNNNKANTSARRHNVCVNKAGNMWDTKMV